MILAISHHQVVRRMWLSLVKRSQSLPQSARLTEINSPTRKNVRKHTLGSWVTCTDPAAGMFCTPCQEWHLEQEVHGQPVVEPCHWTSEATCRLSVAPWFCSHSCYGTASREKWEKCSWSSAAREAAERSQSNCEVIQKLLRSTYFLANNKIAHTTVYLPECRYPDTHLPWWRRRGWTWDCSVTSFLARYQLHQPSLKHWTWRYTVHWKVALWCVVQGDHHH